MKVITLNLRYTANRWQERFPMIIDLLHTEQPDFVGFQEVSLKVQQAHLIQGALNYLNPNKPYKLRVADDSFEPPILANAILSRYPIESHERKCLSDSFRIAQRIVVQIEGITLVIANTHLHHKPYRDESIRLPQMQTVIEWLITGGENNTILMGDFNARPDSETIQYATTIFNSAYRDFHGCEPGYTFPTPLIDKNYKQRVIDYIFCQSLALDVINASVIGNQPHPSDATLYPSDHFAICAEFNII